MRAFFDIAYELEPEADIDQLEAVRRGIRWCFENGLEPLEALEAIKAMPEPYVNADFHMRNERWEIEDHNGRRSE